MAENFLSKVKSDPRAQRMVIELLKKGNASVIPKWLLRGAGKTVKIGGVIIGVVLELATPGECHAPKDDYDY